MEREDYKALPEKELLDRIKKARQDKNAVILAHNYQRIEIQHIADYCGDSLELSRIAARTDANIVVFCGVDFMAESAKILAPEKTVLLPEINATCPMAHMVGPEELKKSKDANPEAVVVAYVNTSAEVKALSDICCTSANSLDVVKTLGGKEIIFVPDKNLAKYTRKMTGANITPWNGYCFVHNNFTVEDVNRVRTAHPDADFLVHPESPPEVIERADYVFSTSGMAKYVAQITDDEKKRCGVIIGTEIGLVYKLQEQHPDVNIWHKAMYRSRGTNSRNT